MATAIHRKVLGELTNAKQETIINRLAPKSKQDQLKSKSNSINGANNSVPLEAKKPVAISLPLDDPELLKLAEESDTILQDNKKANDKVVYERDFLLKFKDICTDTPQGILPEILRNNYVAPPLPEQTNYVPPYRANRSNTAPIGSKKSYAAPRLHSKPGSDSLSTPGGGVVLVPDSNLNTFFIKHLTMNSAFADLQSGPIVTSAVVPPVQEAPKQVENAEEVLKTTEVQEQKPEMKAPTQAVPTKNVHLEWRAKSVKKTKPKETDERRLQARQKQIDIGKATVGYQEYIKKVSKEQRKKGDPRTPNKYQVCSKRSWDGQVRKWRRMLHMYDPPGTAPVADFEEKDEIDSESDEEDFEEEDLETETVSSNKPVAALTARTRKLNINLEKKFEDNNITV